MSFPVYFDEDSQDHELVQILRARGLIVYTVNEQNMRAKQDEEELGYATSIGMAIFTYNVPDFCRIHSRWAKNGKTHSGIIVANQQQEKLAADSSTHSPHQRPPFRGRHEEPARILE